MVDDRDVARPRCRLTRSLVRRSTRATAGDSRVERRRSTRRAISGPAACERDGQQLAGVLSRPLCSSAFPTTCVTAPRPVPRRRASRRWARWCARARSLLTITWASAKAATCGRWVTTSTWWSRAEGGQRPADRQRRLAADAGIDLVEHEGGRRGGEHQAQGQHGAGQLAAGGHLGERQRRRPRGWRPAGTARRRRVVAADVDRRARLWAWPGRGGGASHRLASRGAAPVGPAPTAAAARARPPRACRSAVELGHPFLVARAGRQPLRGFGAVGQHVAERAAGDDPTVGQRRCRTCAAGRPAAAGGPAAPRAAPGRRRWPRRRRGGRRDVGQLGRQRAEPHRQVGERCPRPRWRPGRRPPSRSARRLRRLSAGACSADASRWASASASASSSASSRSSSSGSVSAGGSISSTWNRSRSISRARAPASPPRLGELPRRCRRTLVAGGVERREIDRRRSGRAASRCAAVESSDWWACWPCRSTSRRPSLGQRRRGGHAAVTYARDRPSAGTTRESTTSSPAISKRPSTTASLGARSHEIGVGPAADEQVDGARPAWSCPAPVSPVSAVMPGPSTRRRSAMTPRSATASSQQHRRSARADVIGRSTELGLQDPVEVAAAEGHEAGRAWVGACR